MPQPVVHKTSLYLSAQKFYLVHRAKGLTSAEKGVDKNV